MALYVTPEKKEKGQENFAGAVGTSRRGFLKAVLAGTGGIAAGVGAGWYFGYKKPQGGALKVGLIGAGDEGGVLTGYHNPDYTEIVAVSDIRPYNMWPDKNWAPGLNYWEWSDRIFRGDEKPTSPRKGLHRLYGKEMADRDVKRYVNYRDLLDDPRVEAIIIALPLHLHAPVAIEAMQKGKHVFCEKLMARNVKDCKRMILAAQDKLHEEEGGAPNVKGPRVLAIGHQRHYSLLYDHALEVVKAGTLGDIRHIRALWHRNNTWPRLDKDKKPRKEADGTPILRDSWRKETEEIDNKAVGEHLGDFFDPKQTLADRKNHPFKYKSMEELVRWRLYERTGGGLMAELGSHQLDASSIFLGKVHPFHVSGVGYKSFYDDDREVDDHVFTTFEFPGRSYYQRDENDNIVVENGKPVVANDSDVVVLTYSSINTNGFEPYGECLMGTHGTLTVEIEKVAALYPEKDPNDSGKEKGTSSSVKKAGAAAVDTSSTTGYSDPLAQKAGQALMGSGDVSKGYREELEDFAYVCKMHDSTDDDNVKKICRGETDTKPNGEVHAPKCHGKVAMADAVMALTANIAMRDRERIRFKDEWFDEKTLKDTPEAEYPEKEA